jgi:hypothetical protein
MCLLFVSLVAFSQPVTGDEKLEARFASVEKLLSESSAARQVQASGSPEALAGQEEARVHLERAREAEQAGDDETASNELALATRSMMQAVSLAGHDGRVQDKIVRDFHSREESIEALLEAHGRVMQENGEPAAAEELQKLVQTNLARANELVEQGQVDEGRRLLDETYLATKVAVDSVRDGETLVRSLNFASKEEEYHYELDRNDTHLMLVRVLLDEKMKDQRISKQVEPLLQEAGDLRRRAEEQADTGDFEQAVATLEESTRQVTRAIRSAGIFIPG